MSRQVEEAGGGRGREVGVGIMIIPAEHTS